MSHSADRWGPFADGIDTTERAARARTLAALARAYSGPSADPLVRALRHLERDPGVAGEALALFNELPSRSRRHALAAYAALHYPRQ